MTAISIVNNHRHSNLNSKLVYLYEVTNCDFVIGIQISYLVRGNPMLPKVWATPTAPFGAIAAASCLNVGFAHKYKYANAKANGDQPKINANGVVR